MELINGLHSSRDDQNLKKMCEHFCSSYFIPEIKLIKFSIGIARKFAELCVIVRNCAEFCGIMQNCVELHVIARNSAKLYGFVPNCTELWETAWHCVELCGI